MLLKIGETWMTIMTWLAIAIIVFGFAYAFFYVLVKGPFLIVKGFSRMLIEKAKEIFRRKE